MVRPKKLSGYKKIAVPLRLQKELVAEIDSLCLTEGKSRCEFIEELLKMVAFTKLRYAQYKAKEHAVELAAWKSRIEVIKANKITVYDF